MDSNESSYEKTLDIAMKMDVSDSISQDKFIVTKETEIEVKNIQSDFINCNRLKMNHTENKLLPTITINKNNVEINTLQSSFVNPVDEKVTDEKLDGIENSDKDSDNDEMEELQLALPESPDDNDDDPKDYDGRIKNLHSTNDSEEFCRTKNLNEEEQNFKPVDITKSTNILKENEINDDFVDDVDTIEAEGFKVGDMDFIQNIKDDKKIETEKMDCPKIIKENNEPMKMNVEYPRIKVKNFEKDELIEKTKEVKDTIKKNIVIVKKNQALNDDENEKEVPNVPIFKIIEENENTKSKVKRREGIRRCKSTPMIPNEPDNQTIEEPQQNGNFLLRSRRAVSVAPATESTIDEPMEDVQIPTRSKTSSKNDYYCWRCNKESIEMECCACPRSWHRRCMGGAPPLNVTNWQCNECTTILEAEDPKTRSTAMAEITDDQLVAMLRHIVQRMKDQSGSQPFLKAVDLEDVPNYLDYVINPMDLSLLDSNIRAKKYRSTESFIADAKWILHNCIIFNTYSSKLTNTAKQMLRVARQEVSEIEACPDCFTHGRNLPKPLPSWFIEPCRRPHLIVWAKLKGFPFWPAKAMPRVNTQGQVDVRFFGEHDRAWVSIKDIFLYSKDAPAGTPRKKKFEMEQCMREVQDHIKKLERAFGVFRYAPQKIQYNPRDPKQIQMMLPSYGSKENKANKKEQSKTEIVKTSPSNNNKTTPTKAEKKTANSSTDNEILNNSNGTTSDNSTPVESRVQLRKRPITPRPRNLSPVPIKTKKLNSDTEIETITIGTPKRINKNKSPIKSPIPMPIVNNVVDEKINDKEDKKTDDTLETSQKTETIKNIPKPTLVPMKKVRQVVVQKNLKISKKMKKQHMGKKFSLAQIIASQESIGKQIIPKQINKAIGQKQIIKEPLRKSLNEDIIKKTKVDEQSLKQPMVVVKTMNVTKPTTIVHSMPPNSYSEILESSPVKIHGTTQQLVSILPKKSLNIPRKVINSKTIQLIQKDGKIVNRMINVPITTVTNDTTIKSQVITTTPKIKNILSTSNKNNNDDVNKLINVNPVLGKNEQKLVFNNEESNLQIADVAKQMNNRKEIILNSAVTITKQEPKNDVQVISSSLQPKLTISRKQSKARKTFTTKPPSFPQQTTLTKLNQNVTNDSGVVITNKQNNETRTSTSGIVSSSSSSSSNFSTFVLPPSEAGPLSNQIHRNSTELANKMSQMFVDMIKDASESHIKNNNDAEIHLLKLKIEKMKWEHEQEIKELKLSNEKKINDLKANLEIEHHRTLDDVRQEAELDKRRCIEETKRKQWCAVCGREAMFFCCWNTAYCDYPCQQKHWTSHANKCAQKITLTTTQISSNNLSAQNLQRQSGIVKQQGMMPKLVTTKPLNEHH